jgi:hypothetical protein
MKFVFNRAMYIAVRKDLVEAHIENASGQGSHSLSCIRERAFSLSEDFPLLRKIERCDETKAEQTQR